MGTLVIPHRFCGPDESGNGGWTCGAVAALTDGPAEVTLRRPPPLDTELRVEPSDGGDGGVLVLDGEAVVAESTVVDAPVQAPQFVDPAEAEAAAGRYAGLHHHPFPHCFTCGTAREPGDGLRLFTGPVDGRASTVASPFAPPTDLVDDRGDLTLPAVWAALDCPTAWSHMADGTVAVLGRLRAVVHRPVPAEGRYVVVGRGDGAEGRKRFGSAGLYTLDGELLAASTATWITLP